MSVRSQNPQLRAAPLNHLYLVMRALISMAASDHLAPPRHQNVLENQFCYHQGKQYKKKSRWLCLTGIFRGLLSQKKIVPQWGADEWNFPLGVCSFDVARSAGPWGEIFVPFAPPFSKMSKEILPEKE